MKRSLLVILVVTGVLAAAVALVSNYATQDVPDFFKADPWRVWLVLGVLVLTAIIIALVGARIPDPAVGDFAVPRLGTGNQSLRPPDPLGPVRGRLRLRLWLNFGTAHGLVVLAGAGGMGKSTLANAAACSPQRLLLQRTHWIRLRDEEELARRMAEVAQELGLKPARIAAAQQAGESLPDLIWRHLDRKLGWMIVLDNIDRADATSPEGDPVAEYRGWIRPPRWGLLLVTSRDREGWGLKARVHRVGPLDQKAAAKVLRDLAPSGGSDSSALRLAQRLGGLPLALQVAARSINAPMTKFRTFDAYANALEALPGSLLPDRPDVEDPQVHRRLIGYTWELSLNQLASESLQLARPLMRLLALCADAPIPQQFIESSLLQDLVGEKVSEAAITGALSGLCRFGLVDEGSVVDGVCAIEIHPVVRESMAALLTPETEDHPWRPVVDAALIALTQTCVADQQPGRSLARVLAPHLLMLSTVQQDSASIDPRAHETACTTLYKLGEHLVGADDYERATSTRSRRIFFWSKPAPSNPDRRQTFALCHDLADALHGLGKYRDSLRLHEDLVVESERHLGSIDHDTLAYGKCLETMTDQRRSDTINSSA